MFVSEFCVSCLRLHVVVLPCECMLCFWVSGSVCVSVCGCVCVCVCVGVCMCVSVCMSEC